MKQRAVMFALLMVCAAGAASAQTAAVGDKYYLDVTGGATFGHKTGGSIGAEGAYFVLPSIGIFAEAGWMSNVLTAGIQNDANFIASAVGLSASAKTRLTYFDVGGTYRFPMEGRVRPYLLLGVGLAHADNVTKFASGGTDVTGQLLSTYGVQLGTDLSGSYNKVFGVFGLGVRVPVGRQWFGDISYRYGYVGKNTSDNADIPSINTNRLQFGFGARF